MKSVKIKDVKITISKSQPIPTNITDVEENHFSMRTTDDPSIIMMSFDTPRKDYQNGIFIFKGDSNFLLPDESASALQYSKLEIIANDYIFENNSEYPYVVVLLNVNYEL